MEALLFVDVTDPAGYVGAVRFERAAALFTIITGEPVSIGYRASERRGPDTAEDWVRPARISGIDLNIEDRVPVTDTTDAWRLITWAGQHGPEVARDLVHRLWRAHFLEGADLADPLVLAGRAGLVGLDILRADEFLAGDELADAVAQQRETALALGANSAPFIALNARHTIEGVHSQDDYVTALKELWSGDQEQS